MERLKTTHENIELFFAGLPNFPRNFSRDSIITGIVAKDAAILRNQLVFSAKRQGKKKDPMTGEEFGKIFHEYPGFPIDGFSTEFNACDTSALFIIGHEHYYNLTKDPSLVEQHKQNILDAVCYIKSHLKENLFLEDPAHCGADRFALKVTYWKDSQIAKREKGIPVYPVAYFLAHAINLAGIRSAIRLLNLEELRETEKKMKESLHLFFEEQKFFTAIDAAGKIECASSDLMHALFYLEQGDLNSDEMSIIENLAAALETEIGYLTLHPEVQVEDTYHSTTIWPFEQAVINIGANRFGLKRIEEISKRIFKHLDSDPEIFIYEKKTFKKGGCDPQLWSIAAKKYFSSKALSKS